jgi:succinate dehydrogenase/fumarate reductase iron-sulfur protein
MPETYQITIQHFDSSTNSKAYNKTYEVPADPQFEPMTALKALHYINRYLQPVAYDYNCRRGTCGRCAMMIDGLPRLACATRLTGKHKLAPLAGFPVIRDLVVDKKRAYSRFVTSAHTVKTRGARDVLQPMDVKFWEQIIYPLNACRECMCCYAGCQSLQDFNRWGSFAGPGALQAIYLRSIDGQDKANRIEQAVFSGLFMCVQCGNCTTNCPAGIQAAENIKSMMDLATGSGLAPTSKETNWWPLV